jgi:hypothetical protein
MSDGAHAAPVVAHCAHGSPETHSSQGHTVDGHTAERHETSGSGGPHMPPGCEGKACAFQAETRVATAHIERASFRIDPSLDLPLGVFVTLSRSPWSTARMTTPYLLQTPDHAEQRVPVRLLTATFLL